jgi:hypothetical protein
MNIAVDRKSLMSSTRIDLAIADGDIHPRPRDAKALDPYLAKRWIEHLATYGFLPKHGYQKGPAFPKVMPDACRRDAWTPEGGRPGSSLAFMAEQHLTPNNVELGVLNAITPAPGAAQNLELSAALSRAMNEWQVAEWTSRDSRLKASIVVPYEDGPTAAAEIRHWAGSPHFVQVLLMSRTAEPLGQRRYWPLYEAAEAAGLPIGVHAFGYGGYPVTGGGWPSYYIEEMSGHAQCCEALLMSMVVEGVFERFPKLKLVLIESGFAWLPSLAWRLDKIWKRLKSETPHLKRLPSEYIRDHVWFTTQPMEEPERRKHLAEVIDWIGWDRLLFATDYPHWDWDDPTIALPIRPSEENRRKLFRENARRVYGQ